MSFAITDEQRMLGENLRRYLAEANEFEHRRQRLSAEHPDRLALWANLADMGVLGAAFDEASGGYAGDARSVALLMAELGRALAVEPVLACAVMAGRVLRHANDLDGIGQIIGGEKIVVLAHDAGADPFALPRVRATQDAAQYRLSGVIRGVRHADVAHEFLVSAACEGETAVFRVAREQLDVRPYRLMDAAAAAELRFDGLVVDASARLDFALPAKDVLADALDWGLFGLAAEALGLIEAANTASFQYLTTRKQFGVLIGTFQALQHRAADMKVAEEELRALLNLAIEALNNPVSAQRSALMSAAKASADAAGRRVGHEAVQMHGGMGVSDELNVSHIARRLAAIRAEYGSADTHRLRFGADRDLSDLLALQESEEGRAWRQEVRAFTHEHLPESIALKGARGLKIGKEDYVGWQKVLSRHGLFGCAWPREHGGQDWDLVKQLVFTQESAVNNAPMLSPYGVKMVGPVIYTFGSEAQKRQHLPGILSNDVWWCQGYSEPGAGSDLASLKTFAERHGDHYVVNGAKLWTTEAHWADWMHCLVRTDRSGKPQTGISFLLIDMRTPGISIKPIVTIDGLHHTNATFFDNVRVPVENCVGGEGKGWAIAKFLLGNERVSIADTGPKLRLLAHVRELYRRATADENLVPQANRQLLSAKLADVSIQLLSLCALERQCVEAWAAGAPFGVEASILKIRGSEILQAISELALEIEGPLGAAYDPDDLHRSPTDPGSVVQQASSMAYEYLYARCWSIFGGTNEIQRNLISRQILGI